MDVDKLQGKVVWLNAWVKGDWSIDPVPESTLLNLRHIG